MPQHNVKRFLYMPTTNALLDKVKESCSLPSDNVLSHKLGVTRAVISGWRNDRYPIPDERIAQLCAMAKLDGGEWMARIHAERAASPAEKALWRSVLDRLSAAAAVVALLVLAVHTGAHEALLAALSPVAVTHPLYIMRNGVSVGTIANSFGLPLDQVLPAKPLPSQNGTRSISNTTYNLTAVHLAARLAIGWL
ncbi:DUF3693 domain-containing protein [Xanthomonas campestris pv. campestris]|nr:DUF3693 domain-containing protein [Xanthomonas campestris]